jgi:uncharacterized protein YrrD
MRGYQKLGRVLDIVIQKSDLSVKAVIMREGAFFFDEKKAISVSDIQEFTSGSVLVVDDNSPVPIKESIRVFEAIKDRMFGVGQIVRTKSGKLIGKVYDYTFHNETGAIEKFYVKSIFNDRIISRDAVVKLEGKRMTIEDDFEVIKTPAMELDKSIVI